MNDCGWGKERCAEMAEESSWFFYLLTNWTFEFAFVVVCLVVILRLPADAWLMLLGDRKPNEGRK